MQKNEAVDDFLGDLGKTAEDPFKADEDPFSQEETKPVIEEDAADEEKPLPFHKDPKVQKYVDKQIAKALETHKPTEVQQFAQSLKDDEQDEVMDVLTEIIGNDSPEKIAATKRFKRMLEGLEEKGATRALAQLQREADSRTKADEAAERELTDGFESIEEEFGVDLSSKAPQARKDRAEFIEYVKKIAPKNEYGEIKEFPDFLGTFESFRDSRKTVSQPNNRAKDLAARGMSRSADASAPQATGKTWADIDRLFSKLS